MRTVSSEETFDLHAPAARVFPLLCPAREHDWIPTWRATIVHSRSGFAELDCVFTTDTPDEGQRTWVCTRYEPSRAIAYTAFSGRGHIMSLNIDLEPLDDQRTRVHWRRRMIATTEAGNTWIDSLVPERISAATQTLARLLAHYLDTGAMLRP